MRFFKNLHNEIDFFFRKNIKLSRKIKENIEQTETSHITEWLQNLINVEKNNIKILDIGAKNWYYVKELYNFFKFNNFEKEIWLDGIEIDAFRVYIDLHTRYDHAMYYSKDLKNCRYIAGDFLKHNEKYDYITWFYPFVTENPLLEWGLPLSTFRPLEMLQHAVASLKPGGIIIIKNQDEKEYIIQENLFQQLNVSYKKEPKCLITMSQNMS
ncbi:MAG: hypothetical protein A2Y25_04860 [Candidatus Melainabacteria bacterium GWF2_37_15]|nr:MAG: hypothetical protein A2Y25_04860 [Candidatus Melainabacteria bacterium GWF2_37_15]